MRRLVFFFGLDLYHGLGKVGAIATRGLSLVSTSGEEDLQLKYLIVLFNLGMWFSFPVPWLSRFQYSRLSATLWDRLGGEVRQDRPAPPYRINKGQGRELGRPGWDINRPRHREVRLGFGRVPDRVEERV